MGQVDGGWGVLFQPREGQGLPEATHQKCPQDPRMPQDLAVPQHSKVRGKLVN